MNPIAAGLACRCPNCGRGPLFEGFLKVRAVCAACGFDLGAAEAGDGPAVFIILAVGLPVAFLAVWSEMAFRLPIWLHLALWPGLATGLSVAALRPFKAVLVALQFHNRAREHRSDD